MLRTAHKILTGIIIALGVLHVLVTFHDYDSFSIRALWFAGAGVAIILAGFLNIVSLREVGKDTVVWTLLHNYESYLRGNVCLAFVVFCPQP